MPDAHPGDFDATPFEAARGLVSALEGASPTAAPSTTATS